MELYEIITILHRPTGGEAATVIAPPLPTDSASVWTGHTPIAETRRKRMQTERPLLDELEVGKRTSFLTWLQRADFRLQNELGKAALSESDGRRYGFSRLLSSNRMNSRMAVETN